MDTNGNLRGYSPTTWRPSRLWWTRSSTLSALAILVMAGCGGARSEDDAGPGLDAGRGLDAWSTIDADLDARGAPGEDAGRVEEDDAARPPGCASDAECADAIDCTTDTCVGGGTCRHTLTSALCAAGESCDPATGCTPGRICATSADCADEDPCTTIERCDPAARTCVHDVLDGDRDGDPPRVCGGGDCDDANAAISSLAAELCNGMDDNCNASIDDALMPGTCAYCLCRTDGAESCYDGLAGVGARLGCLNPLDIDAALNDCAASGCTYECSTGAVDLCECPGGLTYCASESTKSCTDVAVDTAHCGRCGNACPRGATCVSGTCVLPPVDAGPPDAAVPRDAFREPDAVCGVTSALCCPGATCFFARDVCVGGVCEYCGEAGGPCCVTAPACSPGLACAGGTCR